MKTIWIAVGLLVLVLAGSLGLHFYSSMLYNELQDSLGRIERAVQNEDWETARGESKKLEKLWAKTDATWTPVMDHRQVDRLDESLTRIFKLIEQQKSDELAVELALARRLAKRIKDTETPGLRNIF